MSQIALSPNANGAGVFTIASPNSGTNRTLTLPDETGTLTSTASTPTFTGAITAPAFIPNGSSVPTNGLYLPAANNIGWSTNTTERMRVDDGGRLLIGRTASASSIAKVQAYTSSGSIGSRLDSGSIGTNDIAYFIAETTSPTTRGGSVGIIRRTTSNACGFLNIDQENGTTSWLWTDNSGNFRISATIDHVGTTNGTVVGTQTSDERLKNVLGPVDYGLETVNQISPVRYALKSEPDVEKLGFIAQQVQPLVPQVVFDTKEPIPGQPEDAPTKLGMEYSALVPVLVRAIQELNAKVEAQAAEIAALKGTK